MRGFTQSLCEMVNKEQVSREVALDYAPNRESLKSRLKGIDTDGDGALTEAELTAAQQAHMKAMHETHGGKHGGHRCPMQHGGKMPAFEDIDTDGDGCISPAEFDAHHAGYQEQSEG